MLQVSSYLKPGTTGNSGPSLIGHFKQATLYRLSIRGSVMCPYTLPLLLRTHLPVVLFCLSNKGRLSHVATISCQLLCMGI